MVINSTATVKFYPTLVLSPNPTTVVGWDINIDGWLVGRFGVVAVDVVETKQLATCNLLRCVVWTHHETLGRCRHESKARIMDSRADSGG